ncbi:MAG: cytochrome c oxidase assembly protein [Pseudomonadota bacterium]
MPSQTQQQNIKRSVIKSCLIVLGMCGFVVALVPLYDLFCEITGLNGKTGGPYTYDPATTQPDRSRLVKVNFITNTHGGMTWEFFPEKGGVRVHPGELKEVSFFVKNTTDKVMVGQAIPSLVPVSAAEYFHKTECFCFNQQVLQPGEEMEMPMRFIVGRELPNNVKSINLSYALFDITDNVDSEALATANVSQPVAGAR